MQFVATCIERKGIMLSEEHQNDRSSHRKRSFMVNMNIHIKGAKMSKATELESWSSNWTNLVLGFGDWGVRWLNETLVMEAFSRCVVGVKMHEITINSLVNHSISKKTVDEHKIVQFHSIDSSYRPTRKKNCSNFILLFSLNGILRDLLFLELYDGLKLNRKFSWNTKFKFKVQCILASS